MQTFNFKAVIGNKTYTGDDLDAIQHDRHKEVLRLFQKLRVPIISPHQQVAETIPLEPSQIDALSPEEARTLSLQIRQSYESSTLRSLLAPKLAESDAMWKQASLQPGPLKVAPAHIIITGIPVPRLRAAMSLDKLHTINATLNPEHFFAYTDTPEPGTGRQRLRIMETFGMYGAPSEVHAVVDPNLEIPGDPVERRSEEEYPLTMRGYTTLASDGSRVGIYAFHQFRNFEEDGGGIDARLGCILPAGTPDEIVHGHKIHMAVEWWELAKIAAAGGGDE